MQAMRERKKKKASKIESPQRQLQPPLPQEPERMAAGSSDALKAAVAAGTDNKMVFPSRYLDVPALYETQVRIWAAATIHKHLNPIRIPPSWSLGPLFPWPMLLTAFPPL